MNVDRRHRYRPDTFSNIKLRLVNAKQHERHNCAHPINIKRSTLMLLHRLLLPKVECKQRCCQYLMFTRRKHPRPMRSIKIVTFASDWFDFDYPVTDVWWWPQPQNVHPQLWRNILVGTSETQSKPHRYLKTTNHNSEHLIWNACSMFTFECYCN